VVRLHDRCADADAAGNTLASLMTVAPGFAATSCSSPSGDRMFYLMRTGSHQDASGELWSLNLDTGEKERALPGRVIANYSISADGRRVVFTSAGSASDDGIWVADLDRRTHFASDSARVARLLREARLSLGRDASGVHWRSDGTEGMALGEAAAIAVLQDLRHCYNENFEGFSFTRFDGTRITI
jgi:hypothetical protein